MIERDLVIVGGGPAGMAAAIEAHENGVKNILLLERDQYLGGMLNQCIHTGFGIEYFKETLTGPEYAYRFIDRVRNIPEIEVSLRSFAVKLTKDKRITYVRPGVMEEIKAKAIIMATGCREKTREMIHVAGTRPSGIFSAGLAQKLVNIEGLLPGKEVVIVGSGDIGLIMARRFVLEGAKVKAIIEIQKETQGLIRNVAQCVEDFDIPVYFNHKVSRVYGKDRVEKVGIVKIDDPSAPRLCSVPMVSIVEPSTSSGSVLSLSNPSTLRQAQGRPELCRRTIGSGFDPEYVEGSKDDNFKEAAGSGFEIECDTVLISVGLIPENELIETAGVEIDKKTNSPVSKEVNKTSVPGIFVCGNSFKVYDLVDWVSKDSALAGKMAAAYIFNEG